MKMNYFNYISCLSTAPMKLVMSHAVYFCDHNFVVNCDTIVHFLYVYFYSSEFYIILLGFDCLMSNTSGCYFRRYLHYSVAVL